MITAYTNEDKKLQDFKLTPGDKIAPGTVWIDLLEPKPEEENSIERLLNIDAPTREEMDKIEVTSPFYKAGEAHYMTATVLYGTEQEYAESTAITFILTSRILITLRYIKPKSFNIFAVKAAKYSGLASSAEMVLEGIVESIVQKLADTLEKSGNELDSLLKQIFEQSTTNNKNVKTNNYNDIIKNIGRVGNIISKSRESLVSLNRLLIYFSQIDDGKYMSAKEHRFRLRHMSREIQSLSEYASFLSQRTGFLLDATLGMISVEQNIIIKIFTVAAAVFMPPTLIASIYGMNFHYMPEVDLPWGYPFALLCIIISALLPYFYFKKKGWL